MELYDDSAREYARRIMAQYGIDGDIPANVSYSTMKTIGEIAKAVLPEKEYLEWYRKQVREINRLRQKFNLVNERGFEP